MSLNQSEVVEATLSKKDLHDNWVNTYYSGRNRKFYDLAFKEIFSRIGFKSNSSFLDAGCGNGVHSLRLAENGFKVTAIDFSTAALELANQNFIDKGFNNITLQREDLTSLSFDDNTFDNVLCWGVLMHVPEASKAVAELCRVVKPGGYLIISDNNMNSLQSRSAYSLRKLFPYEGKVVKNLSGIEFWSKTTAGEFLVRKFNMRWLKKICHVNGLILKYRNAGQFTSLYTWFKSVRLRSLIIIFDELWYRFIKLPYLAEGNILIFKKQNTN